MICRAGSKLADWISNAAFGFFIGLAVTILVGFWIGGSVGEKITRVKAVEAGVAEWVAQPDGSTVFRFKELKELKESLK